PNILHPHQRQSSISLPRSSPLFRVLRRSPFDLQTRTTPMKIELEIDGRIIEVEFTFADGAAQLTFGGATREAQVSEPEPGMFTIIINDRVYRCALEKLPSGAIEVIVNGKRIPIAARDRKHLRGQAGGAAGASGQVKLTAARPGEVVSVELCEDEEHA